jgi:hypothetical protein
MIKGDFRSFAVAKLLIIYVLRGVECEAQKAYHYYFSWCSPLYDFHEYHVNLIYPAKAEKKTSPLTPEIVLIFM